jgi:hypothetical protein
VRRRRGAAKVLHDFRRGRAQKLLSAATAASAGAGGGDGLTWRSGPARRR